MTLLGEQPDGTKTEHDYCATLHELPVGEVDIGAVLDVLKPIWASKPETASRLRGRIEKVIDFAIVHGLAGDVGPSIKIRRDGKDALSTRSPRRVKSAKRSTTPRCLTRPCPPS